MEILTLAARELPFLVDRLNLLSEEIRSTIHEKMKTAEFRNCRLLIEQCDVLRKTLNLTFPILAVIFDLPRSSFHKAYKAWKSENQSEKPEPARVMLFAGPNSTLSFEEEETVLNWVAEKQQAFDCPSVKEVIERATDILRQRCPEAPQLDKSWWKSFKRRYADRLSTKYLDSREFARTKVSADEVFRYFGDVVRALEMIKHPKQVVNMDESGFSSRMEKGRRKKCVFRPDITVEPKFQEERHVSQLTHVAAVNLAGEPLVPMFITVERSQFNNKDLQMIQPYVKCTRSPKGYMNEETMKHWIDEIWNPYCRSVREMLRDPEAPVFLIMDNCPSHCTENILEYFQEGGNTRLIWLPPHSSHFLQPLDANYFASLKAHYRGYKTVATTPKVSGKMIRAFRAAWTTSFPPNIFRCWELVGFMYEGLGTNHTSVFLNLRLITALVQANCRDFETVDDELWNSTSE